jgi:O-antigen/teichoic acid export membrane protein
MRVSHIVWNLTGLALPLMVAVLSVPSLIGKLGNERFGMLALAWGLIGYAGALDLGIGRALTHMVAGLRGDGDLSRIPDVLATARRITLIAGVAGGALIAFVALLGGGGWIAVKDIPSSEISLAMLLLAIALPAQSMSATYRGMNEAFLNFKGISLLRVGLGAVNFGGPYLVAHYTTNLPWLVATLVVSRVMALFIFRSLALSCLRGGQQSQIKAVYSKVVAKSLFSFGGWVTLSSVVSPALVQADRFVIAALLSAAAVTPYVLPYEVVVQSLILVGAISSVIFPTLSKMMREDANSWRPYFLRWLTWVAGLMLLTCTVLTLLLPSVLRLWLGSSLQKESIVVGQVLCLGVFCNAIGSMFYALLHAKGRSDLTAKAHLIELPLFAATLVFLVAQYGIIGAAWAWVGRMFLDAAILAWCSRKWVW